MEELVLLPAPSEQKRGEGEGVEMNHGRGSKNNLCSPSLHLEDHLTKETFSAIMKDFRRILSETDTNIASSQNTRKNAKMTTTDFQVAMSKLLGRPPDDEKIVLLCDKV